MAVITTYRLHRICDLESEIDNGWDDDTTVFTKENGGKLWAKISGSFQQVNFFNPTGTPTGSKFLRDDESWQAIAGGGDVSGQGASTDNAIVRWNGTAGTSVQDSSPTITDNGELVLVAGNTTFPSLTVPSGTLMTTPSAGSVERDGNCFYGTTDAGNRGYVPLKHFIRADASRSLPNDTNENAIFNSPTNGRITLETGTYFFEGQLYITGMSATSGNALIDILGAGTATAGTWLYHAWGIDNTTPTNAATQTGSFTITQQSVASIVTATTGTAMAITMKGTFEVTVAGTVIPSIDLVTASAATLAAGSWLSFERIGSTSVVSVGQWD